MFKKLMMGLLLTTSLLSQNIVGDFFKYSTAYASFSLNAPRYQDDRFAIVGGLSTGQLDGWTSYHLAAGLFIAKVAQWLGASDLWAVLWVLIIGVAWEIFEVYIEGMEETYGTRKKWAWNTAADIIVEVGAAWWMVL